MSGLFGKYLSKVRIMFLLYSVDHYIRFIKEYRHFEQLSMKYCAFKIAMIFNYDDEIAESLIKKWKQMGNNFSRFFLNLNSINQKMFLDYFQIPIAGKKNSSDTENRIDNVNFDNCTLLPDGLEDINHLLFYFNNRSLNEIIADIQLPHTPENLEKIKGNGSNWADYIISLPYKEQVFVILLILQN